eukprot:g6097.t1
MTMNRGIRVLDRSTPSGRNVLGLFRLRGSGFCGLDPFHQTMSRNVKSLSLSRASPQTTVAWLTPSPSQEENQSIKSDSFQIIYSSDKSLLNHKQVHDLWSEALGRVCNLQSIERALFNSYGIQAAFVVSGNDWRLIGLARCLSDGVVTALLADVCVHPSWQDRGIGVELVKRLSVFIKSRGPSGFAAFPTEWNWEFLWKCGFRWNRRFKTMTYCPDTSHPMEIN